MKLTAGFMQYEVQMLRNSFLFFVSCLITANFCLAQQSAASPMETKAASAQGESSVPKLASHPSEDWTNPVVDRSVLRPLVNGASLGKMETATYSRELIRLEWRHGDPIDIYVIMPLSVKKPNVALYLYSYPANNDRFMDDGWCQRATRDGLAAVGFQSALTGDRFRNRPMKEWFIPELQEAMASSAHDIQLIIDYLQARGDLSADQVGIFGQGSGASIAILAAAADRRIQALDLLNPWGDWPDWLKASPVVPDEQRANLLTPEFIQRTAAVEPVTFLPQLKDRALRLVQIMADPDTPDSAKAKIAGATPSGKLLQYKDLDAHKQAWKTNGISGWLVVQLGVNHQQPIVHQANAPDMKLAGQTQ